MSKKINADDFSIIKSNKNFKQAVIERSGLTSTFTVAELEKDLTTLDATEREANSQIKISTAAMANVERNHKFISKMSDEQLAIAAYLYETKQVLQNAQKRLKEVKDAKKKYKEVLATVYAKFGFSNEAPTEAA